MDLEKQAFTFASLKHKDQCDDAGRSYFDAHIVQVVEILKLVTQDVNLICAAYLHDTIENCNVTYDEINNLFNKEIADLVLEVTKESQNNFPKLKSRNAILLKFADRLSNLSRMESWSEDRKLKYLASSKFWKTGE